MRVTAKGQVTIPQDVREVLGIAPSSEVEFVREGERVWLRRCEPGIDNGRAVVARMRGRADKHMSTDDIMRLTRDDRA